MSPMAPCPSWCDGTHPDPGGIGNVQHVRRVGDLELVRVEWYGEPKRPDHVRFAMGVSGYPASSLGQLASDVARLRALAEGGQ